MLPRRAGTRAGSKPSAPNSRPGSEPPGARASASPFRLGGPEKGRTARGEGEGRRRLAEQRAGRVDERRVDGDATAPQPRPAGPTGDPPAEQEDDDDRGHPEQQLDDARRPFARAARRVEGGGVEQRRTRGPVAGVAESRAAVGAFRVEGLREVVVGVGVVAGGGAAARRRGRRAGRSRSRGSPPAGSASCVRRWRVALSAGPSSRQAIPAHGQRRPGKRREQGEDDQLAPGRGDQHRRRPPSCRGGRGRRRRPRTRRQPEQDHEPGEGEHDDGELQRPPGLVAASLPGRRRSRLRRTSRRASP